MMTQTPYFWIRKIEAHLQEHDKIPLFGTALTFNWEHFSSQLAARLGIAGLTLRKKNQEWRNQEELKEGLGSHVLTLPLKVGPLSGSAFWMMSQETVAKISGWMVGGTGKAFSSDILSVGFYRYLILQTLDCASYEGPLKPLSIVVSDASPLPETDAFCIDVEIEFNRHRVWGRLAMDPTLMRSVQTRFAEPSEEYLPTKIAQVTELTVAVKIGSVKLHSKQWSQIKPGDFVALESGGYHPRKETGSAYLTIGKTALFQVKVKHNKIQLIDYAFMYEEGMDKNKEENYAPEEGVAQLPEAEGEAVTLKDLPINVVVELSRLRITLEKLIQLVPGNMIELPLKPDQPVHLTINDQLVGKGELVHLGEALGIRILELG
jgi:flagellar motor switch protein FliN